MSDSFRIFGSVANVSTRTVSRRRSVFKRHLKSWHSIFSFSVVCVTSVSSTVYCLHSAQTRQQIHIHIHRSSPHFHLFFLGLNFSLLTGYTHWGSWLTHTIPAGSLYMCMCMYMYMCTYIYVLHTHVVQWHYSFIIILAFWNLFIWNRMEEKGHSNPYRVLTGLWVSGVQKKK